MSWARRLAACLFPCCCVYKHNRYAGRSHPSAENPFGGGLAFHDDSYVYDTSVHLLAPTQGLDPYESYEEYDNDKL